MMNISFNMNDVVKVKIEDIEWKAPICGWAWNELWKYNYVVEVLDFNLEIYGDDYPFDNNVPKNETFVAPSGTINNVREIGNYLCMDYNNSFTNLSVIAKDLNSWPIFPIVDNINSFSHYNVSINPINNSYDFMGNTTLFLLDDEIPDNNTQESSVFLIPEEDGCEEIIENITYAPAIILIHNSTKGNSSYNADTTNISNKPVYKTNFTGQNCNLSTVIELLQNDTFIISTSNDNKDEIIFIYEYDEICLSEDVFIVSPKRNDFFAFNSNTLFLSNYNNRILDENYRGVIAYDDFNETHVCFETNRHWAGLGTDIVTQIGSRIGNNNPCLQIFSVNRTVGKWLEENCSEENTSVTGFFEQADNDIVAYNVWGNVTIPNSPDDNITIISNRLDGWWGETPGDSGVGGAIVLGILKYIKEYEIIPKNNLTFLFTTGEELGFRGAWHYHHSHENDNIIRFIGLDQLAFDQEGALTEILVRDNTTTGDIIRAIVNESGYTTETGYVAPVRNVYELGSAVTDCTAFRDIDGCDTITLSKDGYPWYYHHRAGLNYEEGDSLNNIDPVDVNMTYNLSWDIVKYFCFNPDCWFTNVTYEAYDSDNDGDSLNDYIKANFTINTIIPHDKVMVKLFYHYSWEGNESSWAEANSENYIVTSDGLEGSIVFQIPNDYTIGDFSVKLELFNSTGRINEIIGIDGENYNDTDSSSTYRLYHSLGYAETGNLTQNVEDRISGVAFTANENATANNITVYLQADFSLPPPKGSCMIYRSNDSTLIGTTGEIVVSTSASPEWKVFTFYGDPQPQLTKGVEYIIVCWSDKNCNVYYDNTTFSKGRYYNYTYGSPPSLPSFSNENRLYSIYCAYTAN